MTASPAASPPRLAYAFGAPGTLMRALREHAQPAKPIQALIVFATVLPAGACIALYPRLADAIASTGEAQRGAAPVLCVVLAVFLVAVQALIALLHLAVYGVSCRVAGYRGAARVPTTVWGYAYLPLMVRQVLFVALIAADGSGRLAAKAVAVAAVDPFMWWSCALLYLGGRYALGLSCARAAATVVPVAFVTMSGSLLQFAVR